MLLLHKHIFDGMSFGAQFGFVSGERMAFALVVEFTDIASKISQGMACSLRPGLRLYLSLDLSKRLGLNEDITIFCFPGG